MTRRKEGQPKFSTPEIPKKLEKSPTTRRLKHLLRLLALSLSMSSCGDPKPIDNSSTDDTEITQENPNEPKLEPGLYACDGDSNSHDTTCLVTDENKSWCLKNKEMIEALNLPTQKVPCATMKFLRDLPRFKGMIDENGALFKTTNNKSYMIQEHYSLGETQLHEITPEAAECFSLEDEQMCEVSPDFIERMNSAGVPTGVTYEATDSKCSGMVDDPVYCQPQTEWQDPLCSDGTDNDCDGKVDGDDSECAHLNEEKK
ncbi:MAG: hypothetical protein HOG08_03670 [Candidatus Magasanikbacteria bacterium]|nr:hypothetical protein [Candidatus Magasanikbacteria bacterium]